jgi:hypothetical protein
MLSDFSEEQIKRPEAKLVIFVQWIRPVRFQAFTVQVGPVDRIEIQYKDRVLMVYQGGMAP